MSDCTVPQPGDLITVCHNCVKVNVGPFRFIEALPHGKWLTQRPDAHPKDFVTWEPMVCGTSFGEWQPYAEAVTE